MRSPNPTRWPYAAIRTFTCLLFSLAGCSDGEPADAPDVTEDDIGLFHVLDAESELFLVSAAQDGSASVALLAHKDDAGNAVAVTGAIFASGKDWLRFEVDGEGRPHRIATPDFYAVFTDYAGDQVQLDTVDASGERTSERVEFSEADLRELTVDPSQLRVRPRAAAAAKGVEDGRLSDALDLFGIANFVSGAAHCQQILRKVIPGWKVQCADDVLTATNYLINNDNLELFAAGVGIAGCAFSFLGGPLGIVLACGAALDSVYDVAEEDLDARFERGGFIVDIDDSRLIEETASEVTVWLEAGGGDDDLDSVTSELTVIGGAARQSLDIGWFDERREWSGTVTPRKAGSYSFWSSIDWDDRATQVLTGLFVNYADQVPAMQVDAEATRLRIAAGESVTLSADVTGGRKPYLYQWRIVGAQTFLTQEPTIEVSPTRTRIYEVRLVDGTRPAAEQASDTVIVTVDAGETNEGETMLNDLLHDQFPDGYGVSLPDAPELDPDVPPGVLSDGDTIGISGIVPGADVCIAFGDPDDAWCIPAPDDSDGTIALDIPADFCDRLDLGRTCHDIRCYESSTVGGVRFSRVSVQPLLAACGGCQEPSCAALLTVGQCLCETAADCSAGQICADGACIAGPIAANSPGGTSGSTTSSIPTDGTSGDGSGTGNGSSAIPSSCPAGLTCADPLGGGTPLCVTGGDPAVPPACEPDLTCPAYPGASCQEVSLLGMSCLIVCQL